MCAHTVAGRRPQAKRGYPAHTPMFSPASSDQSLVAVRLPPGAGFVDALEAVWAGGDAVLPVDPLLPEPALRAMLDRLRPTAIIDERGRHPLSDPIAVAPGLALVVTTSGSTGEPKGVELDHAALEHSARASLDRLGARPGDRWLCCLPTSHVAGISVLVRSRLLGTPAIVHPRFDPAAVGAATGASMVSLVPTMLARLLDAGVDLRHFRAVLLGGAAAPPGLVERAHAAGVRVVVSYGMTETCGGCVYDGVPLDGVDVTVDGDGQGPIAVRGPVLLRGYRADPELTAAVLRDGWFHTADLGRWAPDGRLEVLGRADDVVVTGGRNVAPGEVAALLTGHPQVAEAAVSGVTDPQWGQRLVATVVPTDPRDPPRLEDLRAFVRERAAAYKAPRELVVVEELPAPATMRPRGDKFDCGT